MFRLKRTGVRVSLCLLALSSLTYFRLLDFRIHSYADWGFRFSNILKEGLHPYIWTNVFDFGSVDITFWRSPLEFLYGIFGYFNLSTQIGDFFLVFLPLLLLSSFAAYIFIRRFVQSPVAAGLGSLVFSLNTYYLAISTQGHMLLTIAGCFALLSFSLFVDGTKNNKLKYIFSSVIFLQLASVFDFRIVYISSFLIVTYFVFMLKRKIIRLQFNNAAIFFSLLLLLNLFWLLPTFKAGGALQNAALERPLFGNDYWNLINAMTLTHPFWNGTHPVWFDLRQVQFYEWIIPILSIIGIMLSRAKTTYFWASIALIGVFLSKQIGQPLSGIYPWLFLHVPGFNAFREPTKFYFVSAAGYSILVSIFFEKIIMYMKGNKFPRSIVLVPMFALLIVTAIHIKPMIDGSIGALYADRKIPISYVNVNKILNKQNNFFRTFWLPQASHWGNYSQSQPQTTAGDVDAVWSNYISQSLKIDDTLIRLRMTSILTKQYADQLFDASSIKYLIIPSRDIVNDNDFYKFYGNDRNYFITAANKVPWLKKIDIKNSKLAVYENLNFTDYFSTVSSLKLIDDFSNIDNYYTFSKNTLNDNLNFIDMRSNNYSKTKAPLDTIADISAQLKIQNTSTGKLLIKKDLVSQGVNKLYANTGQVSYSYNINNNVINFVADNANDLQVNGNDIGAALATNNIASASLDLGHSYALAQGGNLYSVNQSQTIDRTIGATNDNLVLYSAPTDGSLVNNGSFEDGLWRPKVEDCNNYDSHANISMKRNSILSTNGRYSLELGAYKHTACTSSNIIAVSAGQNYSLNYEYQIKGGQRAGYDLVFNDAKHTVLSADQIKSSGRWYDLYTKFVAPPGATSVSVRLKGYPDDQNKQHALTYYDSVVVQPLNLVTQVAAASTPQYKVSPLSGSKLTASIVNSNFTYKNLITNPSLEDGLWQPKVGDCNAYDDKPLLAMELNKSVKTNGKQSLELDATRHVACTGPPSVAVQEGKSYLLSFDYQSPNAAQAGYYVSFDDDNGTVLSERIPITGQNWHNFTKTFVVPFGATKMSLSVYSYADEYGGIKEINRYDNFSLQQIPAIQNRYYVVSTPNVTLKQPKHISFQLDSPTKKQVQVTGASTPFYLNMSESYHPQWRLELEDAKSNSGLAAWSPKAKPTAVPDADHFNYDDFLNSWYVDPAKLCAAKSTACSRNTDGSYNLKLVAEFAPQRYFYVGLIISGTTLVGCLGYLGYAFVRSRRKPKASVYHDPSVAEKSVTTDHPARRKPAKAFRVDKPQ